MIYYHYVLGGLLLKLGFPLTFPSLQNLKGSGAKIGTNGPMYQFTICWKDCCVHLLFSLLKNISVNTGVSDYI